MDAVILTSRFKLLSFWH